MNITEHYREALKKYTNRAGRAVLELPSKLPNMTELLLTRRVGPGWCLNDGLLEVEKQKSETWARFFRCRATSKQGDGLWLMDQL